MSKLKVLADNITINATQKMKFVSLRVENIVGKGENAGYQHFLLFPQCFQNVSFSGSLKVDIVWKRDKNFYGVYTTPYSLELCFWNGHVSPHINCTMHRV